MAFLRVVSYVAVLGLGAALPAAIASMRPERECLSTDAECFERIARDLLFPDDRGDDFPYLHWDPYYGIDLTGRVLDARKRLAPVSLGYVPEPPPPATLADLEAAVDAGEPYKSLKILRELRDAEPALRDAALDYFEANFDRIRALEARAFQEMILWLGANDIDRLARLIDYTDVEASRTGDNYTHPIESQRIRSDLLVRDCLAQKAAGQQPEWSAAERLKEIEVRDETLVLSAILDCEGEAAGLAFMQARTAFINVNNTHLVPGLLGQDPHQPPAEAVRYVVRSVLNLSEALARWHIKAGRWGAARQAFDDWNPTRVALPLAALGPEVFSYFDRQFLSWAEFVQLASLDRLYPDGLQPAADEAALAYVATDFTPDFHPNAGFGDHIEHALTLIERHWPSEPARRAHERMANLASRASEHEPLRLKVLIRLAVLERTHGCKLPEGLLALAQERAMGTGFGGSVMPWLDRAEIAVAAAGLIRQPPGPVPDG
ncbi:MAG: hypothetical protein HC783_05890, partial [Rhodobacteraceae bacterium]|nr:hypothetical protein [Paracoccaceae bacterium]